MSQATRLRELLDGPNLILAPGAYDVLSAKLIDQAGFPALFTSGFGLSASSLGMPDLGLLTMSESLDTTRRIVDSVSIPVIADMDTGYGNPVNVVRMVYECIKAGIAGIVLEDQVWPKKCGHMDGKQLISQSEHVEKIRAAVHAKSNDDLVIIARTDAIAPAGLDEAISRGRAYVEAGADVLFIEAPETIIQMRTVVESFEVPLLVNIVEGGKTPLIPAKDLESLGFKLAIFPISGLFAATQALQEVLTHLRVYGTTSGYKKMVSFSEFGRIIELDYFRDLEKRFAAHD